MEYVQKATELTNVEDDFGCIYDRVRVMPVDGYNPADYMDYEVQPHYIIWVYTNRTTYELSCPAIKMVHKNDPKDCVLIMDEAINRLNQHNQRTCIDWTNIFSYMGSPYNPQDLQDEIAYWDACNEADDLVSEIDRAYRLINDFEVNARFNPHFENVESARAELEAIGSAPIKFSRYDDPEHIITHADEIYKWVQAVDNWYDNLDY